MKAFKNLAEMVVYLENNMELNSVHRAVIEDMEEVSGFDYDLNEVGGVKGAKDYILDVMEYGVQSGIVPRLLSTIDSVTFFTEHSEDINDMVFDYQRAIGAYLSVDLIEYSCIETFFSCFAYAQACFEIMTTLEA